MKAIEHLAQLLADLETAVCCDDLTDYEFAEGVCTKICSEICRHKNIPDKECWLRWATNMEMQDEEAKNDIPCEFIHKLITDPNNAGSKSRVLSWLRQEWEKEKGNFYKSL